MKEIRLNKIGFNILADTDNVCYALLLKDWQLQQKKGWQPESVWEYIVGDLDSEHRGGTAQRQTNKKKTKYHLAFHCSRVRTQEQPWQNLLKDKSNSTWTWSLCIKIGQKNKPVLTSLPATGALCDIPESSFPELCFHTRHGSEIYTILNLLQCVRVLGGNKDQGAEY